MGLADVGRLTSGRIVPGDSAGAGILKPSAASASAQEPTRQQHDRRPVLGPQEPIWSSRRLVSVSTQPSTALPDSIRKISIHVVVTNLPLAPRPMNSP